MHKILVDLTARISEVSSSTQKEELFAGRNNGSATNAMDYITIQTTGDAQDFGDLTVHEMVACGCSDSHGGLS